MRGDARGSIRIPEWRPDTLTPSVRAAIADLEIDAGPDGPRIDPDWGEPGLTPAERVFGWSSAFSQDSRPAITPPARSRPTKSVSAGSRLACVALFPTADVRFRRFVLRACCAERAGHRSGHDQARAEQLQCRQRRIDGADAAHHAVGDEIEADRRDDARRILRL